MQITSALSNLRSWLTYGNRSKWLVFLLFASTLFVKTMVFHWLICHNIYISSLWKNPPIFFAFWGGKMAPIIFLSSFIWITKKQWWTIAINLVLDFWIIANVFYFKANGMLLTLDSILMADNLHGFWDSLRVFMNIEIFYYPIISLIYSCVIFFVLNNRSNRNPLIFVCCLTLSVIITLATNYSHIQTISHHRNNSFVDSLPIKFVYTLDKYAIEWDFCSPQKYILRQSIISYFPAIFSYYFQQKESILNIKMQEHDEKEISKLIIPSKNIKIIPQYNLIHILVESLESWGINDIKQKSYMPYLNKFKECSNVLFCDKVKSQVKHGVSADGQMINVTGLLPISDGATSKLYGTNEFPGFAHFYPHSAIVNPMAGVWQQSIVTKSYGFKELIECREDYNKWSDMQVIDNIKRYIWSSDTTFCILGITIDSHMPFNYGNEHVYYRVDDMPKTMSAYLNCLHYTDSCIGILVDSILNSPLASNTTIVITGDHTIFRDANTFSDMTEYAQANDINFQAGKTFTPLIIYSPNIQGNIHVTDTCYQMDIFPTILHLIGAEDYYWKGFGVNLLDSVARNNRPITEQEAFILSDKIIRANWFESVVNM